MNSSADAAYLESLYLDRRHDGLYWQSGSEQGAWRRISGPLRCVARTYSEHERSYSIVVELEDVDQRLKQITIPRRLLVGDSRPLQELLLDAGLHLSVERGAGSVLSQYLRDFTGGDRIRQVASAGWVEGRGFLLGREFFGNQTSERIDLLADVPTFPHSIRGDLDSWKKNVAQHCEGNPRLVFAICVSLAAPLLKIAGEDSGGFHIFGRSSSGKTTTLQVAASVYGNGSEVVRTWRATDNGLEAVAAQSNDSLLLLDEVSQCDPDVVGKIVYSLSNQRGKDRSRRDGSLRPSLNWRVLVLSSGEFELSRYIGRGRSSRPAKAGQAVRFIDLPADSGSGLGIFSNLGRFHSGEELARELGRQTREHYGSAIREFINYLASNLPDVRNEAKTHVDHFFDLKRTSSAPGESLRAIRRFGLVYAAGVIASRIGILPYGDSEILNACSHCVDASAVITSSASFEGGQAIEQLRALLFEHAESKFPYAEDVGQLGPRIERWGLRRSELDHRGVARTRFYLPIASFETRVCGDFDRKTVVKTLRDANFLIPRENGEDQHIVSLGRTAKCRYYCICDSVLES